VSANDEMWRNMLEGNDPGLIRTQRFMRHFPGSPRCKMCAAPFGRPGKFLVAPLGYKRWTANPTMCSICARGLDKGLGGAEINATFLFADIRDSTALAERLRPAEFHVLLDRFYRICAKAIDDAGGLVDKYLGDGVVALFVPAFAPEQGSPAASAIQAGRTIVARVGGSDGAEAIPVGVGVHSGLAYVGVMGTEGGQLDFTGVGDTVNTAARLGSVATAGELLVSIAAATEAGLETVGLERRTLELKGRAEAVDVVVISAGPARAERRSGAAA
jgi:adenylate cyclase